MKKLFGVIIVFVVLISIKFIFFPSSNSEVKNKLSMIDDEIQKRGYKTNWFVISTKRHKWYNNLLSNSAKNSNHLTGNAIDIYVLDIDGDSKFDENDIRIFESANNYIESLYPKLKGGLGTYRGKGYFSKHMIHIDTRGYSIRFKK